MAFELPFFRSGPRVEIVNLDHVLVLASEKVASMGELDFLTLLNINLFILVQSVLKDVHEGDMGVKAYYKVKTTGMQGKGVALVLFFMVDV
jgi:hypothetical protein